MSFKGKASIIVTLKKQFKQSVSEIVNPVNPTWPAHCIYIPLNINSDVLFADLQH